MDNRNRAGELLVLLFSASLASGCKDAAEPTTPSVRLAGLAAATDEEVLGFEDPTAWSVSQGNLPPPTSQDAHVEGAVSLGVRASGYGVLTSRPISVLSALTGTLSLDLSLPSPQPNPYWLGAVQLYLQCPSHQIFNAFVGQVELTGLAPDQFHTLAFSLSDPALSGKLSQGCSDLAFSVALNVPWNATGTYLLDDLRVGTAGDSLTPISSCVFTYDAQTYYAPFTYANAAASAVTVPTGPENHFSPGAPWMGQPEVFSPGIPATSFTIAFDGTPLTWTLGLGAVTASAASPACPGTWASAWTGRGPLSTTITTKATVVDPVPTLTGKTMRMMTHLTAGGSAVRVRLSQRYSTDAVTFDAAHVAVRAAASGSTILPETDRVLTFGGAPTVTVPGGADVWSDPVSLTVSKGQDLAISLYSAGTFVPTTEGSRGGIKNLYHKLGNLVDATSMTGASVARVVLGAFEVQVLNPGPVAEILAMGDSITEGACSTPDANGDWPDLLATRLGLLADGAAIPVLNQGIGSGRFASSDGAGLRGLSRLDEWLARPEVRWVTVLMGVNDIHYEDVDAAFLVDAYTQAIVKAHAAGKKIIGIPILPFGSSVKDIGDNVEVAKTANAWIRAHDLRQGAAEPSFDAVIDFEPAVVDPDPEAWKMRADLTCDKVHPNQAGYQAIAASIPLDVFR